jgi:hypothetical protein
MQKGNIEMYIQEFNTLHRFAASVATLDTQVVLRYFIQKLCINIRIGTTVAKPITIEVV